MKVIIIIWKTLRIIDEEYCFLILKIDDDDKDEKNIEES